MEHTCRPAPGLFVCLRRDVTVARRGVTNRFDRSPMGPKGTERNGLARPGFRAVAISRRGAPNRDGMERCKTETKGQQKQTRPELPESARNFLSLAHPSETNSAFTSSSPLPRKRTDAWRG